ncbi:MAG: NADH-quinone oxidoreductase subunit J [Chloroflexi bacterium]|nr:NADH-quinone oxidoreductase subunit J [Chloroflexota bacterium]
MEQVILVILGMLAVGSALGVVLMPSSIYSALMLLFNLISLANLFLMLHAQFIFAAQLLIYAGAILVLFLFVVTLLNPEGEHIFRDKRKLQRAGALTLGLVLLIILAGGLIYLITGGPSFDFAPDKPGAYPYGTVEAFGAGLFTQFLLPFELTSLVLLVALIGSVVLGKRR